MAEASDRLTRLLRLHGAALGGAAAGVLAGVAVPGDWSWPLRAAAAWDSGVLVFLGLTLARAWGRSIDDIRQRAAEMDQAGGWVLPLGLMAAAASLVVVVALAAERAAGSQAWAWTAGAAMATIALSWLFTHVIFALHYAHGYYAPGPDGGDRRGLIFPGEDAPDDWDFLHFALVIGVAAQTADVQIASRPLRRLATLHGLMAFLFNTVIVALAVNMAVGLI
ncbi:MAG TPA: DUF1345 domain-containing protein [Brevundimonas sp.]|uniref:DUF1345 domain-containing protein n=1 Tax=Brevundimonas sp. TaxID=1871086 RepID=UPI002630C8F3|nr:DUF1345 domain-containing protein [Brevundimonas sp.]HRO33638.1 DUF1345 domain-containing protein [Brevundimonas sp.]